jgi:hypothetical protein
MMTWLDWSQKTGLTICEELVPHSQFSLREITTFLKNFGPKKNTLKGNV